MPLLTPAAAGFSKDPPLGWAPLLCRRWLGPLLFGPVPCPKLDTSEVDGVPWPWVRPGEDDRGFSGRVGGCVGIMV